MKHDATYKSITPRIGTLPRCNLIFAAHIFDVERFKVDLPFHQLLIDLVRELHSRLVDEIGDDVKNLDFTLRQIFECHRTFKRVPKKSTLRCPNEVM